VHCSISQMKHQLDATLCRFYYCRVTLHVWGTSTHHQEYLKLVRRPLVRVLSLQVSHHISLLGPKLGPDLIRRCDDLPATITHVPVSAVLVLNTPDDGRLRPKHVEWLCRNKICTVLHQVGVSFDCSIKCQLNRTRTSLRNFLPVTEISGCVVRARACVCAVSYWIELISVSPGG